MLTKIAFIFFFVSFIGCSLMVFNLLNNANLETEYFIKILIFSIIACLSAMSIGTLLKPVRIIILTEKEIERLANLRFLEFVAKITKSKEAEEVASNYKSQILEESKN